MTDDIYRGRDPRDIPNYSVSEAAHYLRMPVRTVRAWVRGTTYGTREDRGVFQPLIDLEDDGRFLTFTNLVEAHVLNAIRKQHRISMQKVRRALAYLDTSSGAHPLAHVEFETDGVDLFVEQYGDLVNATQEGQIALRELLRAHLRRIERDQAGLAARLYPFVLSKSLDQPKTILIDPRVSFGKPTLIGTGVPTEVIADRFLAGESIAGLALDYECEITGIEAAIRYERAAA